MTISKTQTPPTHPSTVDCRMMLLLCLLLAAPAAAYQSGADSTACKTRTPQHGAAPQATVPPYSVSLTAYTPGTPLTGKPIARESNIYDIFKGWNV
jgi:hypothetical protein